MNVTWEEIAAHVDEEDRAILPATRTTRNRDETTEVLLWLGDYCQRLLDRTPEADIRSLAVPGTIRAYTRGELKAEEVEQVYLAVAEAAQAAAALAGEAAFDVEGLPYSIQATFTASDAVKVGAWQAATVAAAAARAAEKTAWATLRTAEEQADTAKAVAHAIRAVEDAIWAVGAHTGISALSTK